MKYSLRSLMRFSLRDLFWLIVVAALVVGWLADHWRQAAVAEAREKLHWENFRLLMDHRDASEWNIDSDGRVTILPMPSAPASIPPKQ